MKKFIIEQKLTAFVNQYRVFDENKVLIAFAQQKRLAMREEVLLYNDEQRSSLLFGIKAEKVMDVHGKFFVRDNDGRNLGLLRKAFKNSLLRSTYEVMDTDDKVVAIVRERSMPIAIFRRLWGLIPVIGELPFVFKYHFDFIHPDTKTIIATYNKRTLFRDHYELTLVDETLLEKVGWQTIVAQAVMLDVMQDR